MRILMRWDSFEDEGLVRKVSAEEGFSGDQGLKKYVAELDRRKAEIGKEGFLK
ncbi:MAG TPA: hypothetical protein VH253_09970 [Phycisphaerae bacterium]|nr:hypothetical protein [Phycisphaerae bacterium]